MRMDNSQSSQVRCAFWQWKQARVAFFFLGPSLALRAEAGVVEVESVSGLAGRLRLATSFLGAMVGSVLDDGMSSWTWAAATSDIVVGCKKVKKADQ